MATEIERKFLLTTADWRPFVVRSYPIRQAYLSDNPEATVRVRVKSDRAFLTVKGINRGISRAEWEYEIPVADADEMAERLAGGWTISKTRHIVEAPDGLCWEIDEFHGRHAPLILAEIELPTATTPLPPCPFTLGTDVSTDPRYYNSTLAKTR